MAVGHAAHNVPIAMGVRSLTEDVAFDGLADGRAAESRFGEGMAVIRLDVTIAALKQDLAGTRSELLRLRAENTDLRQRLMNATERIGKFGQKRLEARRTDILAMVRRQQSVTRSRRSV
jgi:hypothetical protein